MKQVYEVACASSLVGAKDKERLATKHMKSSTGVEKEERDKEWETVGKKEGRLQKNAHVITENPHLTPTRLHSHLIYANHHLHTSVLSMPHLT